MLTGRPRSAQTAVGGRLRPSRWRPPPATRSSAGRCCRIPTTLARSGVSSAAGGRKAGAGGPRKATVHRPAPRCRPAEEKGTDQCCGLRPDRDAWERGAEKREVDRFSPVAHQGNRAYGEGCRSVPGDCQPAAVYLCPRGSPSGGRADPLTSIRAAHLDRFRRCQHRVLDADADVTFRLAEPHGLRIDQPEICNTPRVANLSRGLSTRPGSAKLTTHAGSLVTLSTRPPPEVHPPSRGP